MKNSQAPRNNHQHPRPPPSPPVNLCRERHRLQPRRKHRPIGRHRRRLHRPSPQHRQHHPQQKQRKHRRRDNQPQHLMWRLHRRSLPITKSAPPQRPGKRKKKPTNLVSPAAPTPKTNPTTTSTTTTPPTPPDTQAPQTPNLPPPPLPPATAIPSTASIGMTANTATVKTTPCANPAFPLPLGTAPPPSSVAPRDKGRPVESVPPSTRNSGDVVMAVEMVKRPWATCRRRRAEGEEGVETGLPPGPRAKMRVDVGWLGGRKGRQAWQVRFAVRRSASPVEEGWRVNLRGEGRGSWWLFAVSICPGTGSGGEGVTS